VDDGGEPIARLYDSRLWRRSGLLTVALGIPFEREEATLLDAAASRRRTRCSTSPAEPGIYTRSFARRYPTAACSASICPARCSARGTWRARRRLANVVLVRGTALELPLPAAACDVVHCAGALHLFPDVPRVLAEVARVLKPRGRFTVATTLRADGVLPDLARRAPPSRRNGLVHAGPADGAPRGRGTARRDRCTMRRGWL
jgi:SAM-dependent methyltransferase